MSNNLTLGKGLNPNEMPIPKNLPELGQNVLLTINGEREVEGYRVSEHWYHGVTGGFFSFSEVTNWKQIKTTKK